MRESWTPEFRRRLERLMRPHFMILGFPGRCHACTVDRWVTNARDRARLERVPSRPIDVMLFGPSRNG